MLPIITIPNPILRAKSLPVSDVFTLEIQKLIPEMIDTMHEAQGVGIAAPQVGKNICLVVVHNKGVDIPMINPVIKSVSTKKVWGEEGCLSVPGKFGQVERYNRVTMEFIDATGEKRAIKTTGFFARVIQHELDHLDGILYIDKAKDIQDGKPVRD